MPPNSAVKTATPRIAKAVATTIKTTPKKNPPIIRASNVRGAVIGKRATYIRAQKIPSPD